MSILKTLKKTRLFDFQAGTPAKSSEIDQEFNQFIDTLADIVDDLTGLDTGHTEHITSTSAHSAENITVRESSGLASVNVEQVLKRHGNSIANHRNSIVDHLSSTILIDGESKHFASHVFNDSSVAGDTISDALASLKSSILSLNGGVDLTDINTKLETVINPPHISSFAISGTTTVEVGTNVTSINFVWAISNGQSVKTAKIYDLDTMESVYTIPSNALISGSHTLTVNITNNTAATKTYRLDVFDGNDKLYSSSVNINWRWAVYFGTSTLASLDETGIEALTNKVLQLNYVRNTGTSYYAFASGGYKYLAYPAVMGEASVFTMGGINVMMESTATLSITNANGVATTYNIERTTNILSGSANINVA